MDNFLICLNAVLPLVFTMLLGFSARRLGMLGEREVIRMNKTAFFFFMPCLLFHNIYKADLSVAIQPRLLIFALISVLVIYLLTLPIILLSEKEHHNRSAVLMSIYRSNSTMVGLPIAASLVSASDISTAAVLIAVVAVFYNILAVITFSFLDGRHTRPLTLFASILKNPLIVGSLLGILFAYFGWRLPSAVAGVVSSLSAMSSPLLLFLLGAFFRFDSVGKYRHELVLSCVGRLIVIPALVLPLAWLMGFRDMQFAALIAIFAPSSAINSFTMAQQMGGNAELIGDTIVLSSILCPLTIFFWSMLAKSMGVI